MGKFGQFVLQKLDKIIRQLKRKKPSGQNNDMVILSDGYIGTQTSDFVLNVRGDDKSEIEYPLRLCVEMLHFSIWSCKKTEDMKNSDIKKLLLRFFDEDQIAEAQKISAGE